MPNDIDLSTEALLARRAKAEAATPGPWKALDSGYRNARGNYINRFSICAGAEGIYVTTVHNFSNMTEDAAHIAANAPDVVKAHIDEILRLRSLVQEHEEYIANLELEAASTDNKIDGLAVLLGMTPDTGNRRIIGIIKDEILRLRNELAATECREGEGDAYVEQLCLERDDLEAQVERLERELERLNREADWLAQQFQDCPDEMEPEEEYWDICKMEDCAGVGKEDVAACWRRAARKRAVEKQCQK